MRRFILYLVPLVLLSGCNQGEFVDIIRLGALEKEITLSSGVSADTIKLITNVPYEVRVVSGADWLTLAGTGMVPSSRVEIPFRCKENIGWRRMAIVTLTASSRTDTVYVKQEGALKERIALKESLFDVPAEGGTYTTEVECYRYPDGILTEVSSRNLSASVANAVLTVTVAPTLARDPRSYTASVYYLDGWGEHAAATATFNQAARK